jgi:uncharacterized protein YkwD
MALKRRQFILAASGLALTGFLPATPAEATPVPVSEAGAAAAINAIRAGHRLAPLSLHRLLEAAAQAQAARMVARDEISHRLGGSLRARLRQVGYPGIGGENLSAGRAELAAVLDGWMASPGHRANLLDRRYREFGIAAARVPSSRPSRYRIYWALIFGIPAG